MKITRKTTIGNCISKYPKTAKIFLETGIFCVNCVAADFESIEQGLELHGATDKEIDSFVKRLNKVIKNG